LYGWVLEDPDRLPIGVGSDGEGNWCDHKASRVNIVVVLRANHTPMKMRCRAEASRANSADQPPFSHPLSLRDIELGEMSEEGDDFPMLDLDHVAESRIATAGETVILIRELYNTVSWSEERGSLVQDIVDTSMDVVVQLATNSRVEVVHAVVRKDKAGWFAGKGGDTESLRDDRLWIST
jgi:hypothetical protein